MTLGPQGQLDSLVHLVLQGQAHLAPLDLKDQLESPVHSVSSASKTLFSWWKNSDAFHHVCHIEQGDRVKRETRVTQVLLV